jgi:hypothetical protein
VLEVLEGSGWERTGRHGEHGTMSVEVYETHVAAEEVGHLAQIARLRWWPGGHLPGRCDAHHYRSRPGSSSNR